MRLPPLAGRRRRRPALPTHEQPPRPAAGAAAARPGRAPWLDSLACLALAALALSIRLPGLTTAPTLSTDSDEIRAAVHVAHGAAFPLVQRAAYIGAWNTYLLALAFRLFGFDVATARALTLAFGVATVALTYALARELRWTRLAAALAALLLAVSGAHVVVASHAAWSDCTTPFYTTLATLLVVRAHRRRDPRLLAAVGLVSGLALQTHPTAAVVVLAIAVYGAWRWRPWTPRARAWAAAALLTLLVVYSPVLVAAVISHGRAFSRGVSKVAAYQDGRALTPAVYAANAGRLAVGFGQMLASSFAPAERAARDPAVPFATALALLALLWAARRGFWLPLLAASFATALLPLVNARYELVMAGRYLMPLLPLALVAEAGLLTALLHWGIRRIRAATAARPARLAGVGAAACAGALVAWSLAAPPRSLALYYGDAPQPAFDALVSAASHEITDDRRPGEPVVIDPDLHVTYPPTKSGKPVRYVMILQMLFDMDGVPSRAVVPLGPTLQQALASAPAGSVLLIANPDRPVQGDERGLRLRTIEKIRVSPGQRVVMYRVEAAPASART